MEHFGIFGLLDVVRFFGLRWKQSDVLEAKISRVIYSVEWMKSWVLSQTMSLQELTQSH